MFNRISRRVFLKAVTALGAAPTLSSASPDTSAQESPDLRPTDVILVPDDGWMLWLDRAAKWEDDQIFLPDDVRIETLPVNAPGDGWASLWQRQESIDCKAIRLPATVEENFWGAAGVRPYTPDEYRYAADDPVPQNGAYRGVSWFYRELELPQTIRGKRILLEVRGARMRAEVYLNEKLVGYSIMEELPFTCDLTHAVQPGETNRLAIRITNPGGRYDWVDGTTIRWGQVAMYRSHGFGGLDRGLIIRTVPLEAHIADVWVLNTPEPRTITAKVKLSHSANGQLRFEVFDPKTGDVIASADGVAAAAGSSDGHHWTAKINASAARLWDLDTPNLYALRAVYTLPNGEQDIRHITFGFRWYAPEGIGKAALFRLNGRRIKIYTAISWGFWGHNGLFPTPQLAEREVQQAKRLNLNCLNFHRNVGKQEVFEVHDRLGLLRYMEPGGGKLSIGRLPEGVAANAPGILMQSPTNGADRFSQIFMLEKCRMMVRAFRSHPSLIQYTLQNELGADLKNPASLQAIEIMHAEDPSRCVVLNDGFSPPPRNAAQAWYEPYSSLMHRSDTEPWGGWWNDHQGAGDQWYDRFYKNPEYFTYRQPLKDVLVEFGEMEGCAVADNHPLLVQQIQTSQFGGSGTSYDLEDHKQIADAYEQFFDRWGFRSAFPKSIDFYGSMGNKCYQSWQQYLENVRICDEVDFAAISGWESTSIENHSGIVDNLRNFKGDPKLIAGSLQPLRPLAKQHSLSCLRGQQATFDLYLLNETGHTPAGRLRLEMIDPQKKKTTLGMWNAPHVVADQFSYLVQPGFVTPELTLRGEYTFLFRCESAPEADFRRNILVTDPRIARAAPISVGMSGVTKSLARQLGDLPGVHAEPFRASQRYDVIVASGVVGNLALNRQVGEETGLENPPAAGTQTTDQILGHLQDDVIAAIQKGTPLLAATPDDFLADGVARQLAALGAFTYNGQVGSTRAPWMGNWLFVRDHATFQGLPTNCVLGVQYQAPGKQANGLLIERARGGKEPEVIMGYSRDHDRKIGAASFVCTVADTKVLFHRAPDFSPALQAQWLANALMFLSPKRV